MLRAFFFASALLCLHAQQSFQPAVNLTGPLPQGVDSSVNASINASGTALVVWDYYDGTYYSLHSSLYQAGSWTPIDIVSPTTNMLINISNAALNSSGTAVVAWQQPVDGSLYSAFFNGSTWSAETLISGSQGLNPNTYTNIGYNDLQQAIVVWSYDGDDNIYANLSSNGAEWQTMPINVSGTGNGGAPVVALSNNQTAIVAWNNSFFNQNYYATYDFQNDTWSIPAVISPSLNMQSAPQIAINSSGQAVVTWLEQSDSLLVIACIYSNGSWGSSAQLANEGSYYSYCAIDESGNAYVIWATDEIQAAVYSNGSWGAATNLSDAAYVNNFSIAAAGSGLALGVWNPFYEQTVGSEGYTSVHASTYTEGSWLPNTATIALSSEIVPDSADFYPYGVGLNDAGQAVVAWNLFDGNNFYVQASLSSIAPSPPATIRGQQKKNRLPFQTQYYNTLQWTASPTSGVVGYQVFRDGVLLATISGLEYTDNAISLNQAYTYSVAALHSSGTASAPLSVTINP